MIEKASVKLEQQNIEVGIFDIWFNLDFDVFRKKGGNLDFDFHEEPTCSLLFEGAGGEQQEESLEVFPLSFRSIIIEKIEAKAQQWVEAHFYRLDFESIEPDDEEIL